MCKEVFFYHDNFIVLRTRTDGPPHGPATRPAAARRSPPPDRGAAPCRTCRPPGAYPAAVGTYRPPLRETFDTCIAVSLGKLFGPEQHLAEPVPDAPARTSARLHHSARTLPHPAPQPLAEIPCIAGFAGRRQGTAPQPRTEAVPAHVKNIKHG